MRKGPGTKLTRNVLVSFYLQRQASTAKMKRVDEVDQAQRRIQSLARRNVCSIWDERGPGTQQTTVRPENLCVGVRAGTCWAFGFVTHARTPAKDTICHGRRARYNGNRTLSLPGVVLNEPIERDIRYLSFSFLQLEPRSNECGGRRQRPCEPASPRRFRYKSTDPTDGF